MKFIGTRPTYQVFAAATFITGCIYYLFNKFYIGKRAVGDENDICKKKPANLDIEKRESLDKINSTTDVASENEINMTDSKAASPQVKLVTSSTDGSTDSGVDNPAYNEHDMDSNINEKGNDEKNRI